METLSYSPAGLTPLARSEQATLIAQAQNGDAEAKERLVAANLRLVRSLVRRFYGCGREEDDLLQIGAIGLLKAIERFDLGFQVAFSTYAVPLILGEVKRYLRDDRPLGVSRSLKEQAGAIARQRERWHEREGRDPSVGELAGVLDLPREQVVAALEASQPLMSLQQPWSASDGSSVYLEETLTDSDPWQQRSELRLLLAQLPPRLGKLLYFRYFLDRTQKQVAECFGISQVQVSRLEKQALAMIRQNI